MLGKGLRVYPNPAHGSATVQVPAVAGAATATLTLADGLGRTVRTATLALPAAGGLHVLTLAGLAPGVYALRVQAGSARTVRRIVVQ